MLRSKPFPRVSARLDEMGFFWGSPAATAEELQSIRRRCNVVSQAYRNCVAANGQQAPKACEALEIKVSMSPARTCPQCRLCPPGILSFLWCFTFTSLLVTLAPLPSAGNRLQGTGLLPRASGGALAVLPLAGGEGQIRGAYETSLWLFPPCLIWESGNASQATPHLHAPDTALPRN